MAVPLSQLPSEVLIEVRRHRWLAFLLFAFISLVVLAGGFLFPYEYESEVLVLVDDSNILGPLMQGAAEQTEISDKAASAREYLWTREVLEQIASSPVIFPEDGGSLSEKELQIRMARLRDNIDVLPRGGNYFVIRYSGEDPGRVYLIAQKLGQLFIAGTNENKREESRAAYEFIDRQVKAYEAELLEAEEALKKFKSQNTEGTEEQVSNRIASLRGKIELAKLELQELVAARESIENELQGINRSISREAAEDKYASRLQELQNRLDDLRLRYHDSYPDILSLEQQIAELKALQKKAQAKSGKEASEAESTVNPLYQEVKAELVKTNAEISQMKTRIASLQQLLSEEEERMEKVQANQARLAELTRDMEVNRSIYNDLLRRREKARLSMHLDVQGQGLSYKIQEPAQYPLAPSGLKFKHFAIAGLLLGILAPYGIAGGLLQIDPRIRSKNELEEDLSIPVLGDVGTVLTPYDRRQRNRSLVILGLLSVGVVATYTALAAARILGIL